MDKRRCEVDVKDGVEEDEVDDQPADDQSPVHVCLGDGHMYILLLTMSYMYLQEGWHFNESLIIIINIHSLIIYILID